MPNTMNWISHISTRAKLILLVGVCALGILMVAITALRGLQQAIGSGEQLAQQEVSTVQVLGELRANVGNMRRLEKDMFLNLADEETLNLDHKWWREQVDLGNQRIAELRPLLSTEEQLQADNLLAALAGYAKVVESIHVGITRGEVNDPWRANQALEPALVQVRSVDEALSNIGSKVSERVTATVTRLSVIQRSALQLTVVVSVASLGVMLVLGYAIGQRIILPLASAAAAIECVARGDLGTRVSPGGSDEMGRVLAGIQRMQDNLGLLVTEIREGVDNINAASQEIATGNQDLSARTVQAASNLQQTSASMEELTSTVRQSADAARQANELATSAAAIAARGGRVVGQVVATMDDINHSSKKINDIIGVIDGIAFQTNILALNAAVEAARAGEQGRGFAVVAGEVRNLAQRSAQAAKEIKGLIGASVDKVEAGSKLVADAGQTMSEIVGSVQRVSDMIGEITSAASEQSDGIGHINAAVNQLDQITQQNAALVQESAGAAQSLQDQAARLSETMNRFGTSVG
ncbi:methyl-accepting chemotaxis protein [Hydrogenophaga sp.]|uniref:methyl-accepting chemotaxis protein n=1 Tax=Hydrogenophaga sp. TaxID=1904254 RepID=UPI0025B9F998|nr:methyl-accepting chemotaxis protein [Hydrogenophaga sp.]